MPVFGSRFLDYVRLFWYIAYTLSHLAGHTDQELLDAIRHDDEKAFRQLFDRYWHQTHIMAYARVRSSELTEEIVQDLFVSLWDKRHTQSIQHLPSYLFQAVKFKALNYVQTKIVHEKYWNYYRRFIAQEENSTQATVEFNDLMRAVEQGLEKLPEKSKKVFRLHRLEGWSIAEIANSLNLSKKVIEYHLTRSLKKMRIHLKNYVLAILLLQRFFQ